MTQSLSRSRAALEVRADPGRIGPIEVAERRRDAGIVKAKQWSPDLAGLVGKDSAHLPAADRRTHGFVFDRQQLAGADRKFVKGRADDAILHVERGTAVFACDALAVLRIQVVVPLVADSAGIVEGFAQGIRGRSR